MMGRILCTDFRPAGRLENIKPSGIRRFFVLAQKMPGAVDLSLGEPDFPPPGGAIEAGCEAARSGKTHYPPTNGIPELRKALARKARDDYGLEYDIESEVLVTAGATEAVFLSLMGILNPGDEVLVPNPGFVLYEPSVWLAGGKPIAIPLNGSKDFKPSLDDVTSLITRRSRVMIINYPSNPTGGVLSHGEIAALARIAAERDMIVISDEVYEKIVYDDARHCCVATLPGMRERTLVVNSFSKTYAMTGLRVGFVYGPRELIAPLWLVHQYTAACVNGLAQYIALAAVEGPQDFVETMVREFDRRRRLVHARLKEIQGFKCSLPEGAFYAFPNIAAFGKSSEDFAEYLLKEAGVIVVPGSAFGHQGEGYVRVSYAAAYDKLEEALDRMEKAVKRLA